jgi:APA family basic amino acid/polyamine antiporter
MELFRKKAIIDLSEDTRIKLIPCLSRFDLIFMGVGAIIGAGIFVITGIVAATKTGPAILLSYIVAGLACAFSALAYAELSASVGGCGSAYSYAYAGLGEIIAWIVGWDLILEYTISVSAVSVGWSGYCNDLLRAMDVHIPHYLLKSPMDGGVFNILASLIIGLLTILLILGVKVSTRVNNLMVLLKLSIIGLFIAIASFHVNTSNWEPFMPFGWNGVMAGASLIFFAYIGFDAVSTAAEETIHPKSDLPVGIIGSLVICTVIYMLVAGLLTGIASYKDLNVPSPISHAMLMLGYKIAAGLIGVGAIAGLTTVMLVLFYGLTRVFFALSRDGLLPPFFSAVGSHKSPVRIIVLCGIVMALFAVWCLCMIWQKWSTLVL